MYPFTFSEFCGGWGFGFCFICLVGWLFSGVLFWLVLGFGLVCFGSEEK